MTVTSEKIRKIQRDAALLKARIRRATRPEEPPTRECDFCGTTCDGRYCSKGCAKADIEDDGRKW